MSCPSLTCDERPCPRRSWATTRKPASRKNSIRPSQSSAESGQPWWNMMGRAVFGPTPVLVENLHAVLGHCETHDAILLSSAVKSPSIRARADATHQMLASDPANTLDPVLRDCMIDIMTPERFIKTCGPVRIVEDETGILWRKLW